MGVTLPVKDSADLPIDVALSIASWLRKRGKQVRPELSREQRDELKECFDLIDADGSGAIDVDELDAAFKVLGLSVKRSEIEKMLMDVDRDGSGEVEYAEFVEIMTTTLEKKDNARYNDGAGDHTKEEEEEEKGKGKKGPALPFQLLATAYRRKKLLEAVMLGDKSTRERMAEKADKALTAQLERKKEIAQEIRDSQTSTMLIAKKLVMKQRRSLATLKARQDNGQVQKSLEARARQAATHILDGVTVADMMAHQQMRAGEGAEAGGAGEAGPMDASTQERRGGGSEKARGGAGFAGVRSVYLPPLVNLDNTPHNNAPFTAHSSGRAPLDTGANTGRSDPSPSPAVQTLPMVTSPYHAHPGSGRKSKSKQWLASRPMSRYKFIVPANPFEAEADLETHRTGFRRRVRSGSSPVRERQMIHLQAVRAIQLTPTPGYDSLFAPSDEYPPQEVQT